ncbi:MAG: hypothetical protein K9L26_03150 [Candidatus Izimaplasma sp.]|nr:hypothetical protein [Candidatus Izimaplasma bacterium]
MMNLIKALSVVVLVNVILYLAAAGFAVDSDSYVIDVVFLMTLGNVLTTFYLILRYVNNESNNMTMRQLFALQNPATFYIADALNKQDNTNTNALKQLVSYPRILRIYAFMFLSIAGIITTAILYVL